MDRKLLDYLPPVLREVLDFQAINKANEPEIAAAWDALALVLANQFLETADAHGVSVWEKELKIVPKDTDSLAERKARIKAMWNLEIPYTIPWLKSWMANPCGPVGHGVTVSDYTIRILLDYTALPDPHSLAVEILDMLQMVRPCSMRVLMAALLQLRVRAGAAYTGSYIRQAVSVRLSRPLKQPHSDMSIRAGAGSTGTYIKTEVTIHGLE